MVFKGGEGEQVEFNYFLHKRKTLGASELHGSSGRKGQGWKETGRDNRPLAFVDAGVET